MTIRVFLVDDQALVRAGFAMVIDSQDDMEVAGEAADGGEALERLAVTRTDVVLMDVRMPRMDGVAATERVGGLAGAPRVIVLTTFDLDEYVFSALKAGAAGFLLKDAPPEDLLSAIRSVASGDAVVAPSATRRLLERFTGQLPDLGAAAGEGGTAGDGGAGDGAADLTEREREVLLEVARGLSNAEVAERLFLSEATIKTHVGRILTKLGLRDRVQMVVFAYERGLVHGGSG